MRRKATLLILALFALGSGAAALAAAGPGAQTQPSGALVVTYYYMPG
jgi:hypothetical protein